MRQGWMGMRYKWIRVGLNRGGLRMGWTGGMDMNQGQADKGFMGWEITQGGDEIQIGGDTIQI